ncbi:hypothetical protein BV22DRAFT_1037397 [Leucogyrophana mollusca]|uniref:Uncharacterized protein n=1 Tax=Leucogyrophana mollusca TaxID=85980 RepID=A0ACB8BCI0_9AGAM|nr:hypothetical protein BV22DRAFT_1037397 [Leucogyrophana mollusca]
MAPKKSKASKMSLNEFLGDNALGSWADEVDSLLPSGPSGRTDDDRGSRPGDRFGRRDDFGSTRSDRPFAPPREDLPLPTQPPYTAFIGNLAFDITESELGGFFSPHQTKSIKIIKDRDEKPKGFGYIEFVELEGLKDAISRTGNSLSGRTVRVSVAEPPKGGSGFGGFDDDAKFDGNWRREGPVPHHGDSRDGSRRRFDGPPSGDRAPPSVSDEISQWRSSKPASRLAEPEVPSFKRRGSGFSNTEAQGGIADKEDVWTMGSKFKPTEDAGPPKFGSVRGRYDSTQSRDAAPTDEGDWRSARSRVNAPTSGTSPTNSTPPTPQLSRRKLELLPRSGNSTSPSPLSSPKIASSPAVPASRANPFGAAKPVDVSSKEKEVTARIEKEREAVKERAPHSMSRTSSRQASERVSGIRTRTPPPHAVTPPTPSSPRLPNSLPAANVRPSFSFANAAGAKKDAPSTRTNDGVLENSDELVGEVTDQVAEVST